MKTEYEHREEIVHIGRMLYEREYIAATEGNLSARLGERSILCTPAGVCKGTLCTEFKETNHLEQIRDDGQLQYRVVCLHRKAVTYNKAAPPQTVVARYAEGLKAGQFASVIEDVVTGVWSKQDAPVPSFVFGVAVK